MVVYIVVNYSLDVFHDQTVTNIYSYFLDLTLLLNTISLPIMAYVIMTQSSKMGPYKWFLLNGVIWDYAFDLILSIWQPVPLFPFYMAYINGLVKNFINQIGCFIILAIALIIFINMSWNQTFSFLYRLAHISPFGPLFFETPRRIFPTMAFCHLLVYFLFITPLAFLRTISKEEWVQAIETEAPVLMQFLTYPGIFGLPYHVLAVVVMRVMAAFLIGACIISIFSCIYFYYKLKDFKKNMVSLYTYKLQVMLFAALVSQTVNMIIFLFIPVIVILIMASSRFKYSSYTALFVICCISLHGIADAVTTVYFIKPYREFFGRILGIISRKMSLSQNVSAIEHVVPNGDQQNQIYALTIVVTFSQIEINLRQIERYHQ